MNSLTESTGGGKSLGATDRTWPFIDATLSTPSGNGELGASGSTAPLRLDRVDQLGDDLVQVAHDPQVGELEDRRVGVLVDRDDVLRGLHPDLVLDRAGDPGREVQLGRDRLAGLPDLGRVR